VKVDRTIHGIVRRRKVNYNHYIRGRKWKKKRQQAFLFYGRRCQSCGCTRNLQVHHKTYDRLGREWMSDLAVLCNDCHGIVHGILPDDLFLLFDGILKSLRSPLQRASCES